MTLTTAALTEYFERDTVEDARLDGVTHAISQLQRDLDTLAAGFGRFVRYSFYTAPVGVTEKIVERAEGLYAEFLAKVCEPTRTSDAGGAISNQTLRFPTHRWRLRHDQQLATSCTFPLAITGTIAAPSAMTAPTRGCRTFIYPHESYASLAVTG